MNAIRHNNHYFDEAQIAFVAFDPFDSFVDDKILCYYYNVADGYCVGNTVAVAKSIDDWVDYSDNFDMQTGFDIEYFAFGAFGDKNDDDYRFSVQTMF